MFRATLPASVKAPLASKAAESAPLKPSPVTPLMEPAPLMLPLRWPFGPRTSEPAAFSIETFAPPAVKPRLTALASRPSVRSPSASWLS